jgi:hypothetical protein
VRSVTSLLGDGLLQLLAQEMTEALQATRDAAAAAAKAAPGTDVTRALVAKSTSFGSITVKATAEGQVAIDVSRVEGVDPDLVVRAMGWKGDAPLVRNVTAGASRSGWAWSPRRWVGKYRRRQERRSRRRRRDPRAVGGDVTAMTVYTAALETPTAIARLPRWVMPGRSLQRRPRRLPPVVPRSAQSAAPRVIHRRCV